MTYQFLGILLLIINVGLAATNIERKRPAGLPFNIIGIVCAIFLILK
jgi:hypothetical protein